MSYDIFLPVSAGWPSLIAYINCFNIINLIYLGSMSADGKIEFAHESAKRSDHNIRKPYQQVPQQPFVA